MGTFQLENNVAISDDTDAIIDFEKTSLVKVVVGLCLLEHKSLPPRTNRMHWKLGWSKERGYVTLRSVMHNAMRPKFPRYISVSPSTPYKRPSQGRTPVTDLVDSVTKVVADGGTTSYRITRTKPRIM